MFVGGILIDLVRIGGNAIVLGMAAPCAANNRPTLAGDPLGHSCGGSAAHPLHSWPWLRPSCCRLAP
jgi:hypothetical protein